MLEQDPEAGKPLVGELGGCYGIRAAAQRYRVIYRIVSDRLIVVVVAAGIRRECDRRDIYEVARRLIRNRLVDPGRVRRRARRSAVRGLWDSAGLVA